MPLTPVRRALARTLLTVLSARRMSRVVARLADRAWPGPLLRAAIRLYVRVYGVDLGEAAEPLDSYRTFNAFFTRRLRPGARPIADGPGLVVSPSDSELVSMGPVPADGRLEQVKGLTYGLEDLLGSATEASAFRHGRHATLYLSPGMYHRVHAPVDGCVVSWRYLPGRLFPVSALSVRHVPGLFVRNERLSLLLESDAFGPVAVVLVGAANVGRITLSFAEVSTNRGQPGSETRAPQPIPVRRGDHLATFNLGSTVVLLVADPTLDPEAARGAIVRVGQPLWRKAAGLH
jgi:phosphatidylserine decarboxylase